MSEQSEKVLENLLDRDPDGVPWDNAVQEVKFQCDVQESTAEAYIRTSEVATVETDLDGDKIVKEPSEAETVVHNEDEVLEMEVGDSTGRTFGELEVLEDVGHPEVPRAHENGYFRRRMQDSRNGGLSTKTDVKVITSAMADPDFSTLLIGKHGVGKDKLILHTCANTNRPVLRMVANDDPDFVDLLVGTYAPNGDGQFTHKKGLLSVAIENGYTFVLDEFNALSGKVQTMLNMILESADQSQLVIPETNQVIEPHPEFNFVATMNPNTLGYGGREDLDQATASRFIPIKIPPLQEDGEKQVIAQETHWDDDSYELGRLLGDGGVVSGIRSLHDMGQLSTWISTRDIIQIGRMTKRLNDVQAAAELILLSRADPEDEEAIRDKLNDQRW